MLATPSPYNSNYESIPSNNQWRMDNRQHSARIVSGDSPLDYNFPFKQSGLFIPLLHTHPFLSQNSMNNTPEATAPGVSFIQRGWI
jgi:hypothetical protein